MAKANIKKAHITKEVNKIKKEAEKLIRLTVALHHDKSNGVNEISNAIHIDYEDEYGDIDTHSIEFGSCVDAEWLENTDENYNLLIAEKEICYEYLKDKYFPIEVINDTEG